MNRKCEEEGTQRGGSKVPARATFYTQQPQSTHNGLWKNDNTAGWSWFRGPSTPGNVNASGSDSLADEIHWSTSIQQCPTSSDTAFHYSRCLNKNKFTAEHQTLNGRSIKRLWQKQRSPMTNNLDGNFVNANELIGSDIMIWHQPLKLATPVKTRPVHCNSYLFIFLQCLYGCSLQSNLSMTTTKGTNPNWSVVMTGGRYGKLNYMGKNFVGDRLGWS